MYRNRFPCSKRDVVGRDVPLDRSGQRGRLSWRPGNACREGANDGEETGKIGGSKSDTHKRIVPNDVQFQRLTIEKRFRETKRQKSTLVIRSYSN